MKRLSFIFVISIFISLFFSCSQGILYTLSNSSNSDERVITGNVDNNISTDGTEKSRSILPELITDLEYDYYLSGKSGVNKLDLTKVELTVSGGNTTFRQTVKSGFWEFTLYALPAGSEAPATEAKALSKSYLLARSCCDLSNTDGTAMFTLSNNSLNGYGSVELDVYLSDDAGTTSWYSELPERAYVQVEIQNMISGRTERGATLDFSTAVGGMKKYEVGELPVGTYNFMVFIKEGGGKSLAVWSDTLSVSIHRNSYAKIYVPNLIGRKPQNINSLTGTYISDSEDVAGHDGYYQVHFQWDAAHIKNEQYFELQVADITENVSYGTISSFDWINRGGTSFIAYTPTGILPKDELPGSANALPANAKAMPFVSGIAEYSAGSLSANSSDAVLWLELGHKYSARIRAVNNAGCSAWTTVTLPDGSAGNTVTPFISGKTTAYFMDSQETPQLSDVINRYRLRYFFNGGKTEITLWQRPFKQKKIEIDDEGNVVLEEEYIAGIVEYHTAEANATANTAVGIPYWNGTCSYDPPYKEDLHLLRTTIVDVDGVPTSQTRDCAFKQWVSAEYFATVPYNTSKIVWRVSAPDATKLRTFRNTDVYAVYEN